MLVELKKGKKRGLTLSNRKILQRIFCLWVHDINYVKVTHDEMMNDNDLNIFNMEEKLYMKFERIFNVFFIEKNNKYIKIR